MADVALAPVERRLATATKRAVEAAGGLAVCHAETGLSLAQLSRCGSTHEPDCLTTRNALRVDRLGAGVHGFPEIVSAMARELGGVFLLLPEHDGTADGLQLTVCQLMIELGDLTRKITDAYCSKSDGGSELTRAEVASALIEVADIERLIAAIRHTLEAIAARPP